MKYYITILEDNDEIQCYKGLGIDVILPSQIDYETLDDADQFIIECEIEIKESSQRINTTEYYGVEIAQRMRFQGFKGKILFVSSVDKATIALKIVNAELLDFKGHAFLKHPFSRQALLDQLDLIEVMDDISHFDCKSHFCSKKGFVTATLHDLKNKIESDSFKSETHQFIDALQVMLDEDLQATRRQIEGVENERAYQILHQQFGTRFEGGRDQSEFISPTWKWEILWLDDDLKEYSPLLKHFQDAGIIVHVCRTYEAALKVWYNDYYLNKITIVIADYRLRKEGQLSGKQGYDFLKYISASGKSIGLIAYSALPRRFLMNSIRFYPSFVHPFSKFDFDEKQDARYLYDNIIHIGDNQWAVTHNQPSASGFASWRDMYFQFRNTHEFHAYESLVSKIAKENLAAFINQLERLKQVALREDNRKITGADILTIELPHRFRTRSNAKLKTVSIVVIKEILLSRRIWISLYAHLLRCYDEKESFEDSLTYLNVVKLVAIRNNIKSKIVENWKNAVGSSIVQGLNLLALDLAVTYPQGLFVEEYQFLEQQKLQKSIYTQDLRKRTKTLEALNKKVQHIFKKYEALRTRLKPLDLTITKPTNKELLPFYQALTFKSSYNGSNTTQTIYFHNDYLPCIQQVELFKHLLIFLNTIITPDKGEEMNSDFVKLLIQLQKVSKEKQMAESIKSFEYFINDSMKAITVNDLINRKRGENRIEEHIRLYEPWTPYLPKRRFYDKNEAQYQQDVALRIQELKKSCTDYQEPVEDDGRNKAVYYFINGAYELLQSEHDLTEDQKINKAIYQGIFNFKSAKDKLLSGTLPLGNNDGITESAEIEVDTFHIEYVSVDPASEEQLSSKIEKKLTTLGLKPYAYQVIIIVPVTHSSGVLALVQNPDEYTHFACFRTLDVNMYPNEQRKKIQDINISKEEGLVIWGVNI